MDIMEFMYDPESGRAKTELHQVKELDKETACKYFEAEQEKPLFMIIRFLGTLDEDDLEFLYITCLRHGLFSIEDVEKEIQEDLEKQPMGQWNIVAYNFRDAFDAAVELTTSLTEDKWMVTITEEAPYGTKEWLRKKEAEKFLNKVREYELDGMTEMEIADKLNMQLSVFRATLNSHKSLMMSVTRKQIRAYKDEGMTIDQISEKTGLAKQIVFDLLDNWGEEGGDR